MQSAENDTLIETKMLNAEFLEEILNQKDDYGEEILSKTVNKIGYLERLSRVLKIDFDIALAIMIGHDIRMCYGKTGEKFLTRINEKYTKEKYIETIIKNRLIEVEENKKQKIVKGIKNILQGIYHTPEEQIVDIINYGYEFADSLENKTQVSVFMGSYIAEVIEETQKNRRITAISINENKLKRRAKKDIINERKELEKLNEAYKYYTNNSEEIPKNFLKEMKGIEKEEIIAYYVASRNQEKIEQFNIENKS